MPKMPNFLRSLIRVLSSPRSHDTPDLRINSFSDLTPSMLEDRKIRYLIIDLDQTVVIQGTSAIPRDYLAQIEKLKLHLGNNCIVFLTNEPDLERENAIRKLTGITVISGDFRKPNAEAYEAALKVLETPASGAVAMVGDRVWTDILGANRLGLSTIQVYPLAPLKDNLGSSIARLGESASQQFGFSSVISVFLTFLTLAGWSMVEFFEHLNSLVIGVLTKSPQGDLSSAFKYSHYAFMLMSAGLYFAIIFRNAKYSSAEFKNEIIYYFNTYPLFLRLLLSSTLMFLVTLGLQTVPAGLERVAFFYSFTVHLGLLLSLSRLYRTDGGRIFRIVTDLAITTIILFNVDVSLARYFLLLYMVPIGTIARYYGSAATVVGASLCGLISTLRLGASDPHAIVSTLIFVIIALVIKFEYKELVFPVDALIQQFWNFEGTGGRIFDFLSMCCRILNCQGAFYVDSLEGGWCFIRSPEERRARIRRSSNEEIFNYFQQNPDLVFDFENVNESVEEQLRIKQASLVQELPGVLRPLLASGIFSAIAASLPGKDTRVLLVVNSLTRNGVSEGRFQIRQVRLVKLLSIVLGLLVSGKKSEGSWDMFCQERDLA